MTEEDIYKTANMLRQLPAGFLPYPIFEQIARLVALPILEIIPLRRHGDNTQVLLLKRDADDTVWPDSVHTPGTVIRATDLADGTNSWPALTRIQNDELQGTRVGPPQYVGSQLHPSKRGVEQAQLYWVEVLDEPPIGTFYDVDDLPDNLIESQRDFIALASQKFGRAKAGV